jgi:hypothetical protein
VSVTEPIVFTTGAPLLRPSPAARLVNGLSSALVVMTAVGGWFLWRARTETPTPSDGAGLSLGVVGFVMMLGAQSLYTLRKRLRNFHRGRMSTWLQAHIFLGLVGAFLVVLHGSGKFHGLAGWATTVMLVMIASGFVGRYVYTAAPRTLDGVEIDARELLTRFAQAERRLRSAGVVPSARDVAALSMDPELPGWFAVLGRSYLLWRQRRRARRFVHRLPLADRSTGVELRRLLVDRYELQLDIRSVAATRHWLAWWHVLHVPLSWVLFTLAAVHIAAALHFSRG